MIKLIIASMKMKIRIVTSVLFNFIIFTYILQQLNDEIDETHFDFRNQSGNMVVMLIQTHFSMFFKSTRVLCHP